jgi:polyisoprenoid-binding protein YceI
VAEQAGERFEGRFPKFTGTIDFDEAAPTRGSITITVDMNQIQVEGKDRSDSLPTDDWFAVAKFPTATFISSGIKPTGPHQYAASGTLTIRNISRPVVLPFTLKTAGDHATATGSLDISRKDFDVGLGRWASDEWVKYPVTIRYEIHASAATQR